MVRRFLEESYCAYCSTLQTPFDGNNYCSRLGHTNSKAYGNVFYIKTTRLKSEEHVSRFTIRAVLQGYQHYYTGDKILYLSKNRFVVFRENQVFSTKIESHFPTEAVTIAYGREELFTIVESLNTSMEDILEGFSKSSVWDIELFKSCYEMGNDMLFLMRSLANAITFGITDELFYEEMRFRVLEKVYLNHLMLEKNMELMSFKKKSTKKEVYTRLLCSKDFIMANLNQKLSLEVISVEASMSPYHYLKCFKEVFGHTPMQFIVKERLSMAKKLIMNTDMPISHILLETGYDNPSSFSRAFRKQYGISPLSLRAA